MIVALNNGQKNLKQIVKLLVRSEKFIYAKRFLAEKSYRTLAVALISEFTTTINSETEHRQLSEYI